MSRRADIVAAVISRMETILPNNGFRTSLGARVYDWKQGPFEFEQVPGINVRDSEESHEQKLQLQWHTLTVNIDCVVSSGTTTPIEMREALADVWQAIGEDQTWSGQAHHTVPVTNSFRTETKESTVGVVSITINILYSTRTFDPN